MLCVRRKDYSADYPLCCQTVTVYHKDSDAYIKTVYNNAFLDFRKNRNVDKTGSHEANSFLLVIPGDKVQLYPGDKVLLGEGGEITTREEWSALIPANVPGLVIIKYVDPKYWNGVQCHVEAGG